MLARMKLVLVQSRGVFQIVASVNPLPHRLNSCKMSKIVTLAMIGIADGIRPARLPGITASVALTLLLTSGNCDVTASDDDVIIFDLYDRVN